ncbi:hypothetical protein LPJ61_001393 [Coemansia biformis]|uniref:Adhesin domain-containing protein n=1 Tax=Coemansia biformis TaxID=1286918 RepID=A0A9W8CZM9_9FUNG|nr:hypothetical protein LPJ61_001393 [Coemansia biformis]
MSDEKQALCAEHPDAEHPAACVPQPPADLEAGGCQRRQCDARARGKCILKKALLIFAGYILVRVVLHAVVGGPGMFHRVYHHGLAHSWGYGCDDAVPAVAHHRPHPWAHADGDRKRPSTHIRPKPIHFSRPSKLGPHTPSALASRINPEALTALIKGELPVARVADVFRHTAELCVPVVPVEGLEKVVFSPAEFGKISNRVVGGIGADVHIAPATAGDEATFEVIAMASSQKIADQISLSVTKGSDGDISLQLDGPKWLGKGDCAYAKVVLRIPESVTVLPALRSSFIYGSITVDRALARAVAFGDFEIDAALSPIAVPPIRANNVVINSVSGGVRGYFHIGSSISIHSVRSDIDAGVNVHKASTAAIAAESLTGEVSLRVAGGFDGSFRVHTVTADVDVEDASDGSNRLHFDKDLARVKAGTFGPADSTRAGNSTLKASTVSGPVRVEFV